MHNTLIASGPDFKEGFIDQHPTGNMDVMPTILQILGLKPEGTVDGRVLSEAMVNGDGSEIASHTVKLEARKSFGGASWSQYLQVSKVGKVVYFDEGNGAARTASKE